MSNHSLDNAFARVSLSSTANASPIARHSRSSANANFHALGDEALARLLAGDDDFAAFCDFERSTSDERAFACDLIRDITHCAEINERMVREAKELRARANASRATSDASAEYDDARDAYDKARARSSVNGMLEKLDDAIEVEDATSEAMLIDVRRVRAVLTRDALEDFARAYEASRARAHEASALARIVRGA